MIEDEIVCLYPGKQSLRENGDVVRDWASLRLKQDAMPK